MLPPKPSSSGVADEIPSVVAQSLPSQSAAPHKMSYKPVQEVSEEYDSHDSHENADGFSTTSEPLMFIDIATNPE
jgi:hypothetical protein